MLAVLVIGCVGAALLPVAGVAAGASSHSPWRVVPDAPGPASCGGYPASAGPDLVVATCGVLPSWPQPHFSVFDLARGAWSPPIAIAPGDLYRGPDSVTLYDPITLPDGDILYGSDRFETEARRFVPSGSPGFSTCGAGRGVLLADGRVLLPGGGRLQALRHGVLVCRPTPRTAIYDPARNAWTASAPMPRAAWGAAAAELSDGDALIVGSGVGQSPTRVTQLFHSTTGRWSLGPLLPDRVGDATAVTLPDGRVLIMGGTDGRRAMRATYLYLPGRRRIVRVAPMPLPRIELAATVLPSGDVMVASGVSPHPSSEHGPPRVLEVDEYSPTTGRWTVAAPLPRAFASFDQSFTAVFTPLAGGQFFYGSYFGQNAIWHPSA